MEGEGLGDLVMCDTQGSAKPLEFLFCIDPSLVSLILNGIDAAL